MKRFITLLTVLLPALFLIVPSMDAKHRHRDKHRMERLHESHHSHHHDHGNDGHKRHKPKHHKRHHRHGPRVVRYYEPERVVYVSHSSPTVGLIPLMNFSFGPVLNATVNMPVPVVHTRETVLVDRDDYYDDDYYWGEIGHYDNNFWPVSILNYEL